MYVVTCLHFNGVGIRAFRWRFPPVNRVLSEEGLCMPRCMLWVIVLHKYVSIWINISYKRQKTLLEYASVHWSVHYTIKNAYPGSSTPTDPSPYVNFYWVLRSRFIPWFLTFLVAVKASVRFHLHTCFICSDYVLERTPQVLLCPLQTLSTIGSMNELTVRSSTPSPA